MFVATTPVTVIIRPPTDVLKFAANMGVTHKGIFVTTFTLDTVSTVLAIFAPLTITPSISHTAISVVPLCLAVIEPLNLITC